MMQSPTMTMPDPDDPGCPDCEGDPTCICDQFCPGCWRRWESKAEQDHGLCAKCDADAAEALAEDGAFEQHRNREMDHAD